MILDQASCLSFLRCLILGGMAESPPWLRGSEKADRLEKLVAALVEEASPRVGEASASVPEKRIAVSMVDRAYRQVSDICKLAAAAAHDSLQSDCKNVTDAHFQLGCLLQVRRLIAKRLLTDVDDEISAAMGLQVVVKRSKTEL